VDMGEVREELLPLKFLINCLNWDTLKRKSSLIIIVVSFKHYYLGILY
jgi:hypothetical protein